jgi:hypothetical protein
MLSKWPKALGVLSGNSSKGLFAKLGIKRGSIESLKLRFVIPCIDVAQSSRAEDFDNAFGLGAMMQPAMRACRILARSLRLSAEDLAAGDRTESGS